MSFYVRAGLYAEGPSDYYFLIPLITNILRALLIEHFPARHDLAETSGLPDSPLQGREHRIAATITEHWTTFTLFIIHADGKNDPATERATMIEPGLELAREKCRAAGYKEPLAAAACIPVHELEAWLLTDAAVFHATWVAKL